MAKGQEHNQQKPGQYGTTRIQLSYYSKDSNTSELKENTLKSNLKKMIEAFKEEMNRSLKEIQENTIKQVKEVNKTVQDLKMKIKAIKKTQSERILEMENLVKRTGNADTSITNRTHEMEV